jgi:branched-subunit amino acid ABC-type transport system permease component
VEGAVEAPSGCMTQLLDVVTTAGILYIVALGLLIVYGVLKIINLAHGAFLALGSYAAVIVTWLGWNPWTALLLAPVIGAAIAALIEWRALRGLYARPLDTILATWGLNIVLVQVITLYFGREIQFAESPIARPVTVGGVTYSRYRLVLLLVALALGVLVWLVMQRTRIGVVARAVIMNEELAQALGINTRLVRFATFCLGAGLASLAGALITPLVSVHPNLGVPWLINAFMLVLVAGVSLGNLALAALTLGGAQVLVSAYGNPVLGSLTIVILAVIILRFRTIPV